MAWLEKEATSSSLFPLTPAPLSLTKERENENPGGVHSLETEADQRQRPNSQARLQDRISLLPPSPQKKKKVLAASVMALTL